MSEALLLALDTSTSIASVALFDGARVLSETTWLAGREHSTRLLIEAEAAFERVGRAPEHLTGIVVACGPGSFTGVRVALSVGKGIASGFGIPAWGVNSLDVLAAAAGPTDLPVLAVLEAGRGRYATGRYRRGVPIQEMRLASLEELVALVPDATVVIGELREDARSRLEAVGHARVASQAAGARRGGYLAELGWRKALSGDPGDPRALDAVYIT